MNQNRKKRSGSSTNGIILEDKDLLTSKRVRINKGFFEDSQICAKLNRKPVRIRGRQTKKSNPNLTEITSDKILDVVSFHRHNEVDIKSDNEDVTISLVHDDDNLGATQIIDILSKLYRATFGC